MKKHPKSAQAALPQHCRHGDEAMRQALRNLPSPLLPDESEDLQQRILSDWSKARGVPQPAPSRNPQGRGGALALFGGFHGDHAKRRKQVVALALLLSLVVASVWWAQRPDPAQDEDLMHPDVLSLMAIDEM